MQAHPEATNPASGPTVPWTSGLTGDQVTVDKDPQQVNANISLAAPVQAYTWQDARARSFQPDKHSIVCQLSVDKEP